MLKAGTTGSTRKHRNQTCRCTFSSYYCTRKPNYYRLNSRWSQRENFDVTKERKPRSCSTGFSPCGASTVKKRSPSIIYWRSAARFTAASNDLTIHWLCICCVILSTYNATEKILFKQMISEPWLCLYLNIGNRLLKEQLK